MAQEKFSFIETGDTLFLNQQVACEYKRGYPRCSSKCIESCMGQQAPQSTVAVCI
jgi:hypothetical protein